MKICIIGMGYVGCVAAASLAYDGHVITCIDTNEKVIDVLKSNKCPIYEPRLDELLLAYKSQLEYTTALPVSVNFEVIIITVGTPSGENGHPDLRYLWNVVSLLTSPQLCVTRKCVVMIKSTIPIGTSRQIHSALVPKFSDVVFCPEFLREGSALTDFRVPDRVVYGLTSNDVELPSEISQLAWYHKSVPVIKTTYESAEMIKYASNAFLATKVAFINEIADLCEQTFADIEVVSKAVGLDARIGPKFLQAGPGYGGSCFPKDALSLIWTGKNYDVPLNVLKSVVESNMKRKEKIIQNVLRMIRDVNIPVTLLGLTFKAGTSDVRESISCEIISVLRDYRVDMKCHDPQGISEMKKIHPEGERVKYYEDVYEACSGSGLIIVATDWPIYSSLDWLRIKNRVEVAKVYDLRNCVNSEVMGRLNFTFKRIGKQ